MLCSPGCLYAKLLLLLEGNLNLSGFFQNFPFWLPLLFFCPFLSLLLLTNQVPMNSIKEGAGTVFFLSLISENIHCTSRTLSFISSRLLSNLSVWFHQQHHPYRRSSSDKMIVYTFTLASHQLLWLINSLMHTRTH